MGDSKKSQTQLISEGEFLPPKMGYSDRISADCDRVVNDKHLFKSIVDSSSEVIALYNKKGGVVYINAAHEKLFHYSLKESLQLNDSDYFAPESIAILKNQIWPALIEGRDWEGELIARDSRGCLFPIWRHDRAILDDEGNFLCFYSVMRNLSERRKIENELREKEQFLQEIFDSIQDGLNVLDVDLTIRKANRILEDLFKDQKPLAGKKCYEIYRNKKEPCSKCPAAITLKTGEVQTIEMPVKDQDNESIKWISLSTFPLKKAGGRINGVIEHVVDVTKRKKDEESLQNTLSNQEALLSTMPALVYLKDKNHKYICVNQFFADFVGATREEIKGRRDDDFFSKEYADKFREDDQSIMEANAPALNFEEKVETLDGKTIWTSTSKTPLRDSNGCVAGIVGVSMDITEKKRFEEHFRQAQKMEAVGHLAGGVAHNVNNLLTGILGNLSIALMKAPDEISNYLRKAQDASQRAAELADNLLAFSRNSDLKLTQLNVNQVIRKVYDLARQTIDRRIDLQINLEEDLPPVSADPAQIGAVLMNLCINARDAINRIINENNCPHRKEDRFEIALESALLDPEKNPCALRRNYCPGLIVVLRVSDNGIGMDQDTQKRIFEPFFTTQKTVGAGLGLASAFGSVAQHNGWIDFTSEYGVGTTFNVYLPVSKQAKSIDSDENKNKISVDLQGKERILIVDDDEMILNLAKEILEENGYKVLLAEDGQQGLDCYFRERDRINLIVLDLSMPKVSGWEFLKKMQNANSSLKIIVSSGYSTSVDISLLKNLGVCGMLPKPYYPRDLLNTVRRTLDGSASFEST